MQVFVKSFGCSTNLADGAVLAGCLAQAGYGLVSSVSASDVVVLNTCAVKGPTENRMIEVLKRVPENKKLVVTGCLPLINFERLSKEVRFDAVVGPAAGERIVELVNKVLCGEKAVVLDRGVCEKPELTLPRLQLSPVVSIVPVNYGCLGSCSYCCVVFARGRLRSYDSEEIVERIKRDLASGLKEFWLTSQDTACYGRDKGTNLAELLNAVGGIRGDFRVRVGMMTPNTLMHILDGLIGAFRDERVFKFLHLPVQSGDDKVLENMRRFYSVDSFKNVVEAFRAKFPKVTVATDVICGFPGESGTAFEKTLKLIGEVKPDIVNVSKFFARPKTAAIRMHRDFVPLSEIKRRSGLASALARKAAFERNQGWVGWTGEILVDEVGKVKGSMIGRNFAYKPVTIKGSGKLLGKTVRVKIAEACPTYLEGEIIE